MKRKETDFSAEIEAHIRLEADRYRAEITERTEREVAAAREQEAQLTREASTDRERLDAEALAEVRTRYVEVAERAERFAASATAE